MYRRRTIGEVRWPDTPDFMAVAEAWRARCSTYLVALVWKAYDALMLGVLNQIDLDDAEDDLERSITQLLEPEMRRAMSGDEPFSVQHGRYEHESRMPAPAQPPAYDIAFFLIQNPRIMWPIEAKVLHSDGAVADYVTDLRDEFLTCRYAPFSSEAGMVGYLVSGDPEKALKNIAASARCRMKRIHAFADRPHRVSDHKRRVPVGKHYARSFRCHHLILCLARLPIP